ncbi:MAG: hypothetical protein K8R48_06815 [Alphaproteobacteria bacterium]|nr:hypothetical protein [Alphaproteobacteria bacterium]
MADKIKLRMKMIEALEETGDKKALAELVRHDRGLATYQHLLYRAANYLQDVEQVEALLELPGIDTASPAYKHAIADTLASIGANEQAPDVTIVGILFNRIRDDQSLKNESLRAIFTAAALKGVDHPNASIAKLLVRNGADPDVDATAPPEGFWQQVTYTEQEAEKIKKFKAKLSP